MPPPSFNRSFLVWDSEAVFAAAGGPAKLAKLLAANDFPRPRSETAAMWRTRGRIPHLWMPMCIYVVLKAEQAKLSSLFRTVQVLTRDTDDDA